MLHQTARRISIHAPTGGATIAKPIEEWEPKISIHAPTGGATAKKLIITVSFRISIHAPTGGATSTRVVICIPDEISIHAPTGGATISFPLIQIRSRFQSTLPRGERRPWFYKVLFHIRDFNPRSHGGSDVSRGVPLCDPYRISIHAPTGGATAKVTKFK